MKIVDDERLVVIRYTEFESALCTDVTTHEALLGYWPSEGEMQCQNVWQELRGMEEHRGLVESIAKNNFASAWHWHYWGRQIWEHYRNQEGERVAAFKKSINLVLFHHLCGLLLKRIDAVIGKTGKEELVRLRMVLVRKIFLYVDRKYLDDGYSQKCLAWKMKCGDRFRRNFNAVMFCLGMEEQNKEDCLTYWLRRNENGMVDLQGGFFGENVEKFENVVTKGLDHFFPV